jgi:hypothetical protein
MTVTTIIVTSSRTRLCQSTPRLADHRSGALLMSSDTEVAPVFSYRNGKAS